MVDITVAGDRRHGPTPAVAALGAMAVVIAAVVAACGGGGDEPDAATPDSVPAPDASATDTAATDTAGAAVSATAPVATSVTTPPATAAPDQPAAGGADAGRCPISVELASEVLGTPMELAPGACQFFPPERSSPTLLFVRLGSGVCVEGMPGDLGYDQQVEGFEVEAWTRSTVMFGTGLLLCTPNAFEVSVDLVDDPGGQERAIVEELARVVLDAGG